MAKDGLLSGLGLPLRTTQEDKHGTGRTRRTPLATMLTEARLVTPDQVEDANAECARTGERLAEVVVRHGWVSEEDVAQLLAKQYELPFLAKDSFAVEPDAVGPMRREEGRRLEACPIGFMDDSTVVAVDDPAEARLREVRRVLGEKTVFVIVTPSTLAGLYDEAWGEAPEPEVPSTPAPVASTPEPAREAEPVPELDTGEVLVALDVLEAALSAGAAAAADVRARLGEVVEASAVHRRALEECRARAATHDDARAQDLERIAQLEEELEKRTKFVDDLKAKLGDVFSGLEAAG
jgi:hypothetical protein